MSKLDELKAMMNNTRFAGVFDIPDSGQIAMSDIRDALGTGGELSLRTAANDFNLPAGEVKMSDFYGLSLFTHEMTIATSQGIYGFYVGAIPGSDFQPRTVYTSVGVRNCEALYVGGAGITCNFRLTLYITGSVSMEFYSSTGSLLGQGTWVFSNANATSITHQALADYLRANVGGTMFLIDLLSPDSAFIEWQREKMRQLRVANGIEEESPNATG